MGDGGDERGAGEILLTSMDRDGTNAGYDLELTAAVAAAVSVPVIASGGAGELHHLVEALRAGADAVLCASIFHYGRHTVAEVKQHLAQAGIPSATDRIAVSDRIAMSQPLPDCVKRRGNGGGRGVPAPLSIEQRWTPRRSRRLQA